MWSTITFALALFAAPATPTAIPFTQARLVASAPSQSEAETASTTEAAQYTTPDGYLVRWASVRYQLTTGQQAEALVEVDERGSSEAWLYLDGEPIVHITADGAGSTTSTWAADGLDVSPDLLAELVSADVASDVFAGLTTEASDPCAWAKAAKYAWFGIIGATAAACCVGATVASGGAACVACGGLAAVAMGAGSDIADGYC